MRKIIAGIIGLVLVAGVTSGTAVAMFSSAVKVNNVAISAGSANLEFSGDGETWTKNYTFAPNALQRIIPGSKTALTFWVRNTSTAAVPLALSAKITAATGDWEAFAPNVYVAFADDSTTGTAKSLAAWNGTDNQLSITVAPDGARKRMTMEFSVPVATGDEIADRQVSTNWEITGTQVAP